TPWPPAKITSCIDCPRTASGDCSPSAQSTASVMLDLPLPFGPTITETPGENVNRVRSGKDLKPLNVMELKCMLCAGQRFERGRGGCLLGALLRAPAAARQRLALDHRHALERPLVWRPPLRGDLVGHDRPPPRQTLLQRRLEVGRMRERPL